jgi:hypothetical protein
MTTDPIQRVRYSPPDQSGSFSAPLTERYCPKDNFVNSVVVPGFEETLPPQGTIGSKIINHLTNAYDLVGTIQAELCDNGRISGRSARELAGVAARSVTSAAVVYGTGTLVAIGAVASGPVAAVGALAAGATALLFGPPAAERVVNWGLTKIGNSLEALGARLR